MQEEFNNLHYNKHLQPNANKLRKEMTKAEVCLWKYVLRGRMMMGFQFRRQRPVLKYIADFMCKELMLVIGTDGITHIDEKVYKKDLKKDHDLLQAGFTVLRFSDNEVLDNIGWVRITLRNGLRRKISHSPLPLQLYLRSTIRPQPAGDSEPVFYSNCVNREM